MMCKLRPDQNPAAIATNRRRLLLRSMPIHPTAIVDPGAQIADAAEIGPYCIIGADVEIGARTRLMANVFLEGPPVIGEDNLFFPYSHRRRRARKI